MKHVAGQRSSRPGRQEGPAGTPWTSRRSRLRRIEPRRRSRTQGQPGSPGPARWTGTPWRGRTRRTQGTAWIVRALPHSAHASWILDGRCGRRRRLRNLTTAPTTGAFRSCHTINLIRNRQSAMPFETLRSLVVLTHSSAFHGKGTPGESESCRASSRIEKEQLDGRERTRGREIP